MNGHLRQMNICREVSSQPTNGGNLICIMRNSVVVVFRSIIRHPAKQVVESQSETMKTHPLFCQKLK